MAIRAIAEARRHGSNMRLEVIGDGPGRSALEDLARREMSDGACAFLGSMDPDLVLARMRLADAVIVPSVWSEPAGFVVLEAMAVGVPVVAADAGGIPEVARGAATLVARSDSSAFARALVELASDPSRTLAIAARGREVAAAYSAADMATRYWIYCGLIGRKSSDVHASMIGGHGLRRSAKLRQVLDPAAFASDTGPKWAHRSCTTSAAEAGCTNGGNSHDGLGSFVRSYLSRILRRQRGRPV